MRPAYLGHDEGRRESVALSFSLQGGDDMGSSDVAGW